MAEPDAGSEALAAREAVDDVAVEGDGVRVVGLGPRSIVSIAFGHDDAGTREAIERGLGVALPGIGESAGRALGGDATLLGLQRDQWFALLPREASPAARVREAIGEGPAVTDQSDAWAGLAIEGPRAVDALARTCRLDLHADAFPLGRVARTAMEHMATIVLREADERFVLLSPRSSAASFAHAMATSVRNVS